MLVIDRNLYARSDVKELINFLNKSLVKRVDIARIDMTSTVGIPTTYMTIDVRTHDTETVKVFLVMGLHPHNADVLEDNINEWMKPQEPKDLFLDSLYELLANEGYTELEFDYEVDVRIGLESGKEYYFDGYTDLGMDIKLVVCGNTVSLYDRCVTDKHFVYHKDIKLGGNTNERKI